MQRVSGINFKPNPKTMNNSLSISFLSRNRNEFHRLARILRELQIDISGDETVKALQGKLKMYQNLVALAEKLGIKSDGTELETYPSLLAKVKKAQKTRRIKGIISEFIDFLFGRKKPKGGKPTIGPPVHA
ncbi:MAG: hypothetical protein PHC64_03520 [Candidatus Gastranaerophilales bacterium]|nr:hypothetical protein [Candidatus Gastranaerophilales bacterium]